MEYTKPDRSQKEMFKCKEFKKRAFYGWNWIEQLTKICEETQEM